MVATVILSIAVAILAEAVGVLAYTVYKMKKELTKTTSNLDSLAECTLKTLKFIKHTAGIEVVEDFDTDDISFPNNEGF